jgi:hypothetical protein
MRSLERSATDAAACVATVDLLPFLLDPFASAGRP